MRGFENKDGLNGTCIIAEVGLSHEGSLGQAIAYVDSLSAIGVDAVKFQCHLAEYESSKEEKFRVNVFPQDNKRQDYWSRTSFSEEPSLNLRFSIKNLAYSIIASISSTAPSLSSFKILSFSPS